MDRLRCLKTFTEVARRGSFVRAARVLSLPRSTVTKQVAWLESTLGAQLLNRSTQRVVVTSAGRRVLEGSMQLTACYEALESEIRESVRLPRGPIRVGTPPSFGAFHLVRAISKFVDCYPEIEVTVVVDDGRADLLSNSLDVSLRVAPTLSDASYVAFPLTKMPQTLVASPTYLKRRGVPRTPKDLMRHNCLVHTVKSPTGTWIFSGSPPTEVHVRGSIRCNSGDTLKQAALLGVGISMHPLYMVSKELQAGLLEVALREYVPQELYIYVVYSKSQNMPAPVRHLVDFLKEWAKAPQPWKQ